MLKIFDNYYLDASSVCYMLKKAHVKGDGKVEYDVCTYHTRLEEALAEAVRRGLREGVAGEKLTEWEQLCGELRRLKSEVQELLESISPADDALDLALENGNIGKLRISTGSIIAAALMYLTKIATSLIGGAVLLEDTGSPDIFLPVCSCNFGMQED